MKNQQDLFTEASKLIEDFDFEKVQAFMRITGWHWFDRSGMLNKLPSIEDLKATATSLLHMVINSPANTFLCGTGGFYAYLLPFESGMMGLKLTFEPFRAANF